MLVFTSVITDGHVKHWPLWYSLSLDQWRSERTSNEVQQQVSVSGIRAARTGYEWYATFTWVQSSPALQRSTNEILICGFMLPFIPYRRMLALYRELHYRFKNCFDLVLEGCVIWKEGGVGCGWKIDVAKEGIENWDCYTDSEYVFWRYMPTYSLVTISE